jgi:type II secretory pathway pseudopilin PulG
MQLIIFAIIVVLAVVFLIVFNMRSAKNNREKRELNLHQEVKEEIRAVEVDQPRVNIKEKLDEAGETDNLYRQALRSFAGEEDNPKPSIVDPKPVSADMEYREALRSMKKEE